MKFFNILLGRGNAAVIGSGARPCAPPAEIAPGAKRRDATMQGLPPFPSFGRE